MSGTYENILEIRDLRVEAPNGAVLVDGISLDLPRGEILGLIGESGAGKSTIGLAAMGYGRGGCRIAGGTITLAGTELAGSGRATREGMRGARIAYVAQSAAAFNPASEPLVEPYRTAMTEYGIAGAALALIPQKPHFRDVSLREELTSGRPATPGAIADALRLADAQGISLELMHRVTVLAAGGATPAATRSPPPPSPSSRRPASATSPSPPLTSMNSCVAVPIG